MRLAIHSQLVTIALLPALVASVSPAQDARSEGKKAPQKTQHTRLFRIFNPDTMAKPTAGYSQVAEVSGGKLVYIAGQVALDRSGNLVGKDDFVVQVQQIFENLKAAVEAAGGDFNSVVKLNYYCAESVDAAHRPCLMAARLYNVFDSEWLLSSRAPDQEFFPC